VSNREQFEHRYRSGDTPWDHDAPDENLIECVTKRPVLPCKVLEIGCGTGNNAVWLARRQFTVTACDISPTAIAIARKRAVDLRQNCAFRVADFLKDTISGAPFGFVFDRGCLHSVDSEEDRRLFSRNVASCLETGGLWLTLTGNADEPEREIGPPRLTAGELVEAVEPFFEILSLSAGLFGSNQQPNPPRAWISLMRKRDEP
jgi:SAM-dependent methyltransferase